METSCIDLPAMLNMVCWVRPLSAHSGKPPIIVLGVAGLSGWVLLRTNGSAFVGTEH